MADSIDYNLEKYQQLKNLNENLYPLLNQGLEILMERLIKTNEVQQHQERLKQKKIRDLLEKKRLDKEKMKEELGSDYVSSESEEEEEESIRNDVRDDDDDDRLTPDQGYLGNQADEINLAEKLDEEMNKGTKGSLPPIEEEEDAQDLQDKIGESRSIMEEPGIKPIFNPIEFLAKTLKALKNGEALP